VLVPGRLIIPTHIPRRVRRKQTRVLTSIAAFSCSSFMKLSTMDTSCSFRITSASGAGSSVFVAASAIAASTHHHVRRAPTRRNHPQTVPPGPFSVTACARARPIHRSATRSGERQKSAAGRKREEAKGFEFSSHSRFRRLFPFQAFLPRLTPPFEAALPRGPDALSLARRPARMSTPGRTSHGSVRWEPPSSIRMDELENVSTHNQYPANEMRTPGRGILKTPGRVKTPGGKTPGKTPKRWNNNPNADHRVTSPDDGGGAGKTPGGGNKSALRSSSSFLARTPGGKTPTRQMTSDAFATTPGKTPASVSRFTQAPIRVAVEVKAKTPMRYRQPMINRKTSADAANDTDANPASVLSTLPNATQAAYWLRRARREEGRGNFLQAKEFLEQGIKRHAEPSQDLEQALRAIETKIEAATGGTKTQSVSGGTKTPKTTTTTSHSGSFVSVTPVRSSPTQRVELNCGATVLTPCRRSARVSPDKPGDVEKHTAVTSRLLESAQYAYVPNTSLLMTSATPSKTPTVKRLSPVQKSPVPQTLEQILASPGSVTMASLGLSAQKHRQAELADLAFEKALVEATDAAKAVTQTVASLTPVKSRQVTPLRSDESPEKVVVRAACTTTLPVSVAATPPPHVTATRGATPSTAYVLQRQLTPNSEFAALEMAVAFEAAMEYPEKRVDARIEGTLDEKNRRVANKEHVAAKEAVALALCRQESMRSAVSGSPRKPPRSPMGAKAQALSRTASVASSLIGTPPARVVCPGSPDVSGARVRDTLSPCVVSLPSIATPSAAPASPFVSPGKAAREAAEREGLSPTNHVALAVANATPGSVATRRRRVSVSATFDHTPTNPNPSPRHVPLPKTPFGEPSSFQPENLAVVTPIAPNAARLIGTPGKGKSTSPLSVFARMMAKVIVDTTTEQNSAANVALMDTP
jgi:hypothetical protein